MPFGTIFLRDLHRAVDVKGSALRGISVGVSTGASAPWTWHLPECMRRASILAVSEVTFGFYSRLLQIFSARSFAGCAGEDSVCGDRAAPANEDGCAPFGGGGRVEASGHAVVWALFSALEHRDVQF